VRAGAGVDADEAMVSLCCSDLDLALAARAMVRAEYLIPPGRIYIRQDNRLWVIAHCPFCGHRMGPERNNQEQPASAPAKRRCRCGICWNYGHRAQNCPVLNEEENEKK
jgi:hypothetical protein